MEKLAGRILVAFILHRSERFAYLLLLKPWDSLQHGIPCYRDSEYANSKRFP